MEQRHIKSYSNDQLKLELDKLIMELLAEKNEYASIVKTKYDELYFDLIFRPRDLQSVGILNIQQEEQRKSSRELMRFIQMIDAYTNTFHPYNPKGKSPKSIEITINKTRKHSVNIENWKMLKEIMDLLKKYRDKLSVDEIQKGKKILSKRKEGDGDIKIFHRKVYFIYALLFQSNNYFMVDERKSESKHLKLKLKSQKATYKESRLLERIFDCILINHEYSYYQKIINKQLYLRD